METGGRRPFRLRGHNPRPPRRTFPLLSAIGLVMGVLLPSAFAPSIVMPPGAPNIPIARGPASIDPYPSCVTQQLDGEPACAAGQLVYDPTDGYVVALMACAYPHVTFASCTWKFSGGAWTNITAASGTNPPATLDGSFVWDPVDHYAVLFGGVIYPSGGPLRTTWEFHGGAWSEITSPTTPDLPEAFLVRGTFDSSDGYLVSVWQNAQRPAGTTYTFTFVGGTWTNLTATFRQSWVPLQPVAADDPPEGGALFFGGLNGTTVAPTNATWLFSKGTWHLLGGSPSPPARSLPTMAYDSIDGYVLLLGGSQINCFPNCYLLSDEWTFSHGTWTNITSTLQGSPPLEQDGSMVTDLSDGYVVEGFGVGLATGSGTEPAQTYLYTYLNGSWTSYAPAGSSGALPLVDVALVGVVAAAIGITAIVVWRRARPPRARA